MQAGVAPNAGDGFKNIQAIDPLLAGNERTVAVNAAKLADFKARFRMDVNLETFNKISGTAKVKSWYTTWQTLVPKPVAMPQEWMDVDLPPKMWTMMTAAKENRSLARRVYQEEMAEAQERFQKEKARVQAKLDAALADTSSDYVRLLESGFNDLSVSDVVAIESAQSKEKREELLEARLVTLRKRWIALMEAGQPLPE
uniref:Uncharacterized protein n=1 Tax=viral metagenome TaxID=1070528 RepID=A0A2V0R9F6_9ZZZZ